jgi:coenzyme F420-0:L-glutamate ligase / coenzyme F420-1:gamma-L-glutamate ligase
MGIRIIGLRGLPEVRRGDDLGALIHETVVAAGHTLDSAAIVVVAQKVVSKAEGAEADLRAVEPSALAAAWAGQWHKDPRMIEVVLRQSRRIVKMDRGVLIAETQHGFVAANAGVDQSNVPGEDRVTLLPADPDASACRLRRQLGCGGVIISDTFGRPWREGLVNVAIGVSGLEPLDDHRGRVDYTGKPLQSTIIAVADEIAAAAGLVMRKAEGVPVALVLGLEWTAAEGSGRALVRDPAHDLFR